MTKKSYLYFANTAIQMEKEEKYDLAAEHWKRAKYLAADLKHRLWAQYNQENNEERYLLHHNHSTALRRYMNKQAMNNDNI